MILRCLACRTGRAPCSERKTWLRCVGKNPQGTEIPWLAGLGTGSRLEVEASEGTLHRERFAACGEAGDDADLSPANAQGSRGLGAMKRAGDWEGSATLVGEPESGVLEGTRL